MLQRQGVRISRVEEDAACVQGGIEGLGKVDAMYVIAFWKNRHYCQRLILNWATIKNIQISWFFDKVREKLAVHCR